MKIIPFYASGWEANSYLIINAQTAVLIDAGTPSKNILEALKKENAELKYILLTHGHFDHTISADALRDATNALLAIHENDAEMLEDAHKNALYTFMGRNDTLKPADILLTDNHKTELEDETVTVIHTPGHSRGSVCYLIGNALFTGDTLFDGGYGRCDLYGGNFEQLCASLSSLKTLDRSVTIYPGHGTSTTLNKALNYLNF